MLVPVSDVRSSPKVGQISPKRDKFGTSSDQIQYILPYFANPTDLWVKSDIHDLGRIFGWMITKLFLVSPRWVFKLPCFVV